RHYRTPPHAGQHSPATAQPSPWSRHGPPNRPHAERNPVLSLGGHNMPPCRTGPRAADLRLLAFLLPKPTAAPSVTNRPERTRGSTSPDARIHHPPCVPAPVQTWPWRRLDGRVPEKLFRGWHRQR